MNDIFSSSGTFTRNAWEWLYETVDHDRFGEQDAELIYQSLENDFKPLHFGRYLQHYIFKKTGLEGVYTDISLKDYQTIVTDAFRENGTPASFTPTTARLSALAKNWLTQQSVKRQALLLMGFGLRMSLEEVNEFLYKVLQEPLLNEQNPFEALCRYCYRQGLGYYKFQTLWEAYQRPETAAATSEEEAALIASLRGGRDVVSVSDAAYGRFMILYDQARELIAAQMNETRAEEGEVLAGRLREALSRSARLYDYEKLERVRKAGEQAEKLTREDISESDLEHILCSAIPVGANGNLIPVKNSTLNAQFEGKRFSRQHINDILLRKSEPERFDLITLNFLIFGLRTDQEENAQRRYMHFIESTNRLLADCFMGPLYVANPYECFVLMCILSVSPLETYTEVIEKSYRTE